MPTSTASRSGTAGALPGDVDTAATFDGTNDHVQALGTTGLPTGSATRSVEAWFRTTSTARQVLFGYGSLGEAQEFALWLTPGATAFEAWGWGQGNDKTFTAPASLADGRWHHVVKVYDGSSLTLYLDGTSLGTQAATRTTVVDAYELGIGGVLVPGDPASGGWFNGSLDEVALYTTALTSQTVLDHYRLGTAPGPDPGPTGGSVTVTGLTGTGTRYSTSTTLGLTLAKGSDSDGLAATGASLRRATASLTSTGGADGACGTFGPYEPVATDPGSPFSTVVPDQACYSFQYVVRDAIGNPTTYTSGIVKVDTTAPSAPDARSSRPSSVDYAAGGGPRRSTTGPPRAAAASR